MNETVTRNDHWVHQFRHDIACAFGVDEAIMLAHIAYWVRNNYDNLRNEHNGETWTYNTKEAFARQFQFWSVMQIRRILKSCETQGLIKTGCFNANAYDKTLWYTLTDRAWEALSCSKPDPRLKPTDRQLKSTEGPVETNRPIPVLDTILETTKHTEGARGELGLSSPEKETPSRDKIQKRIVALYNEAAKAGGFPQCNKLSPARLRNLNARLKEHPNPSDWRPVWAAIADMKFLWDSGENPTWFHIGWLLESEEHFEKLSRNFLAWKKKNPRKGRPANCYFEDGVIARIRAKQITVHADGSRTDADGNPVPTESYNRHAEDLHNLLS